MRLTCPNCGAQYEVADDAIPENGRDVQCSNCGHVWLEKPGGSAVDGEPSEWDDAEAQTAAVEPPVEDLAEDAPVPAPKPDPAPEAEPESESEPASDIAGGDDAFEAIEDDLDPAEDTEDSVDEPDTETDDADTSEDEGEGEGDADATIVKPDLDPGVETILREEAEREQRARAHDAAESLESQGELGIDDAAADPGQDDSHSDDPGDDLSSDDDSSSAGDDEATIIGGPIPTPDRDAARRDQLPDIDEINSSLSPKGEAAEAEHSEGDLAREARGRGFRLGFGIVCIVAASLAFLYLGADEISSNFPQLSDTMGRYTAMVDEGRLWLDLTVQSFMSGDDAGQ